VGIMGNSQYAGASGGGSGRNQGGTVLNPGFIGDAGGCTARLGQQIKASSDAPKLFMRGRALPKDPQNGET